MSKEIHFKIVSPRSTFSSYNKRQLLEMLLRENFDPTRQEEVFHRIRSSRDNPTVAQDYFNEKAVESQQRIEHLMRQSRNDAFERLKVNAKALNDTSETNELQNNSNLFSVAMEAIASQENHPTPDEVDGIDVKKLYEWLANFMAGNPTEVDDGPTKECLKECFTELMDQTESESVNQLKEHLRVKNTETDGIFSQITNNNYEDVIDALE